MRYRDAREQQIRRVASGLVITKAGKQQPSTKLKGAGVFVFGVEMYSARTTRKRVGDRLELRRLQSSHAPLTYFILES